LAGRRSNPGASPPLANEVLGSARGVAGIDVDGLYFWARMVPQMKNTTRQPEKLAAGLGERIRRIFPRARPIKTLNTVFTHIDSRQLPCEDNLSP